MKLFGVPAVVVSSIKKTLENREKKQHSLQQQHKVERMKGNERARVLILKDFTDM